MEEAFGCGNVFDIAFDNVWSKDREESLREFYAKLENNPELLEGDIKKALEELGITEFDSEDVEFFLEEVKKGIENNKR